MIDVNRLNPTTFCTLVLWLNGSFTTSMIVEQLRTTEGTVKAVCKEKGQGGYLPKRRKFMTRGERQELLSYLKHYRMDGGKFNNGFIFTAQPIVGEPEEPISPPDPKTKEGKKQLRELAHEAQMVRNAELREKIENQEGYARRGINADPLNWLQREKLLRDPDDVANKSPDRFSEEMRRHECGLRFRQYLEDAELSGFKEVSLELAGKGGGAGMSIPERFMIARSATESLQIMMGDAIYRKAVAVIHYDDFIWDEIPTKDGRDMMLEDIRRALDTVALFIGMMVSKDFEARWGSAPEILKAKSRDEARETARMAKELIREGVRQS